MGLYELKQKLRLTRERGYIVNQTNTFKLKIYNNLSIINICYYLKHRIPMCHRHFFRHLSHKKENIQTLCNDRKNPFHFACRQWYLYNNPQC